MRRSPSLETVNADTPYLAPRPRSLPFSRFPSAVSLRFAQPAIPETETVIKSRSVSSQSSPQRNTPFFATAIQYDLSHFGSGFHCLRKNLSGVHNDKRKAVLPCPTHLLPFFKDRAAVNSYQCGAFTSAMRAQPGGAKLLRRVPKPASPLPAPSCPGLYQRFPASTRISLICRTLRQNSQASFFRRSQLRDPFATITSARLPARSLDPLSSGAAGAPGFGCPPRKGRQKLRLPRPPPAAHQISSVDTFSIPTTHIQIYARTRTGMPGTA